MTTYPTYSYHSEKLHSALMALALGRGSLRERLKMAMAEAGKLTGKEFPTARQAEWDALWAAMRAAGAVATSIDQMTERDLDRWASQLVELAVAMADEYALATRQR